jgi:dolichol-phosphate mannosyltransferase
MTDREQARPGPELAIIVPTYNEASNIAELVRRVSAQLGGIRWELVVVDDDSPDGTARLVRQLGSVDSRVRCLQRVGRRGLASACIEGMLATSAPLLAVMDGDLQHDESLLPRMYATLADKSLELVVGSRYMAGASSAGLNGRRVELSRFSTRLSRPLIPAELTDPMSGFFMLRREVLERSVHRLSGIGFKILLDLFASSAMPLRFRELPYSFRQRAAGESKLDSHALWDYGMLLLDKTVGRFLPPRFASFLLIGGSGVFVHMIVLSVFFQGLGLAFAPSQAIATLVAMTANFTLNNLVTYRDVRLSGWAWVRGWVSFTMACSVGAVANVGIANYVYAQQAVWPLAGLAGILVGAVWNYVVTQVFTWRRLGPR